MHVVQNYMIQNTMNDVKVLDTLAKNLKEQNTGFFGKFGGFESLLESTKGTPVYEILKGLTGISTSTKK